MIRTDDTPHAAVCAERATIHRETSRAALLFDPDTGKTWTRVTCSGRLDGHAALAWVADRNAEAHLGFTDWRLPNAAELARLKRRFPGLHPLGAAMIETVLPIAASDGEAIRTLQRRTTCRPQSRNADFKTAGDRAGCLWSPVQGGRMPDAADAVRPGHPAESTPRSSPCVRIFVRVPMVRNTDFGPAGR